MTAYFGFEPSESLKNDIQTLLANLAKKAPEPQYHLSSEISKVFTDEVIDNLLLNLGCRIIVMALKVVVY